MLCRSVVEKRCSEVLEKIGGEEGCREVLEKSVAEKCWRRVLEEKCCREVLGKRVVEMCGIPRSAGKECGEECCIEVL